MKVENNNKEINGFETMVRPLIRYLARNFHPHTTIIITSTGAELVEGIKALNTDEYIKD